MSEVVHGPSVLQGKTISGQRWARRRDVVIATLGWILIVGLALWAASRLIRVILIVVLAALLAYALMPVVTFLSRFVPRWVAILLVYVSVVSILGALGYVVITTAVGQVAALAASAGRLLALDGPGNESPLVRSLQRL